MFILNLFIGQIRRHDSAAKNAARHGTRVSLEFNRHTLFSFRQVRRDLIGDIHKLSRFGGVELLGGYLTVINENVEFAVVRVTTPIPDPGKNRLSGQNFHFVREPSPSPRISPLTSESVPGISGLSLLVVGDLKLCAGRNQVDRRLFDYFESSLLRFLQGLLFFPCFPGQELLVNGVPLVVQVSERDQSHIVRLASADRLESKGLAGDSLQP